jgi:mannose-6-phosphate isomerase-like protein (cupin superfamily)
LTGQIRDRVLKTFRGQISEWGIALPATEPLVLDFGLGRFEDIGLIEVWIANEVSAGYCGKYLFVFPGQTCPTHSHQAKHETFFVVEGRIRIELNGMEKEMQKGDMLSVAPGSTHSFTGMGSALLLELSQPCLIDDNEFADPDIPIGGNFRKNI